MCSSDLGWIRRCRGLPNRIRRYPFYSAASAATMTDADACAATGLPGRAPRCQTIEEARRTACWCSFVVSPCRPLTLETSTPPEEQTIVACHPTMAISTSATSTSWGYRLIEVHTGLYSNRNIRTLKTLRLQGDINTSAPTFGFYSSLIVCGAPVATVGGVRLCVRVGRHHCWAAGPLGLGL